MYPIALQIGSFSIRWYGVMAALGLLAATLILNSNRDYIKMTKDQCSNAIIIHTPDISRRIYPTVIVMV